MVRVRYGAAFLIGRRLIQRPSWQYCSSSLRVSFSSSSTNDDSSSRIITYLTDVEGDASYLNRYVEQSKVLQFRESNSSKDNFPYETCIDFTQENAVLVYGGDVWDRGGSDLYVIRQLLDLQKRNEGRVHFVMGNRDLNKMRILSELGIEGSNELPPHDGVYWLKGTGRKGDPLLLDDPDARVPQTSAAERLKWMLSQTMGSPDAFELRRKELQRETDADDVTDQDVVNSYRRSCHPSGEMGQYLQQAHLALKMGKVLFVHGSLPMTQSILKQVCSEETTPQEFWTQFEWAMPWRKEQDDMENTKPIHSTNEWLAALETFARQHVSGWKRHVEQLESGSNTHYDIWSTKGGYGHSTSGQDFEALMQYGMGWTPDGNRNPTVVYSSWLSNGLPYRFFPDPSTPEDKMFASLTREFFDVANLQLICSGHQPHGDFPTRIRLGEAQNILCCDTSYSGDTMWWNESGEKSRTNIGRGSGSSGRGDVAVCEVLIKQDTNTGDVLNVGCHGTLSDGSSYDLRHFPADNNGDVGRLVRDELVPSEAPRDRQWWVKAKFNDGSFLVSSGEGFNVWNAVVRPPDSKQ